MGSEMCIRDSFRMAVYLANRVAFTPLGGKTPFSMWHGGTPRRLEHLRTFGARAFVHEERYVKKLPGNYEGMGRTHGRLREGFKDIPVLRVWNQDRRVPKCSMSRLILLSSTLLTTITTTATTTPFSIGSRHLTWHAGGDAGNRRRCRTGHR